MRYIEGKSCAGCDADTHLEIAISMFDRFREWIDDPTLCGQLPLQEGTKPTSVLGEVMCLASLSEEFIAKLPARRDRFLPFVDDAMIGLPSPEADPAVAGCPRLQRILCS